MYCLPPLHHASGLLTTLGATVVGRSRIALSNGIDPETFATEVQRYGVTVVSYTWSMLSGVVRDPPFPDQPAQPDPTLHGFGGDVAGLWEDVCSSFPRARILEFFATADGSAILANVSGDKLSSVGRPLPETNPVEVAAYDIENDRLLIDESGFVRRAEIGEAGLLLSKAKHKFDINGTVLRDVFTSRDRWEVSGHLFVRDADGDLYFLGAIDRVIRTEAGPRVHPADHPRSVAHAGRRPGGHLRRRRTGSSGGRRRADATSGREGRLTHRHPAPHRTRGSSPPPNYDHTSSASSTRSRTRRRSVR